MERGHHLALAAVLGPLCGCGALLGGLGSSHEFPPPPPEPDAPTDLVIQGEVRDFATYRREPEAAIEFWSEVTVEPPSVTMSPGGTFTIHLHLCDAPGAGDRFLSRIVWPGPVGCSRAIGRFALRARIGTRCSLPFDGPIAGGEGGPLVLWLGACREPLRVGRDWRPMSVVLEGPGKAPERQ